MENQNTQYFIYIRSTGEKVPVTREERDCYMEGINTYRRKQQRHDACQCPEDDWFLCDMDCASCKHRVIPESITNLDTPVVDDSLRSMTTLEYLQERLPDLQTPSIEEQAITRADMQQIMNRLQEIMPEAYQIGVLRMGGMSDDAIAEQIGIPRNTWLYRLQRAYRILKEEYPEYF